MPDFNAWLRQEILPKTPKALVGYAEYCCKE